MTVGERIIMRLEELHMSQKEFSEKTGISQSAISEWKTKKTNPTTDKILIICQVLEVTPVWLLSGIDREGNRGNESNLIVIDKDTELGKLVTDYNKLSRDHRARLLGYAYALSEMNDET